MEEEIPTPSTVVDAIKRRLLNQPEPSTNAIINAFFVLEGLEEEKRGEFSAFLNHWERSKSSLPTIGFVKNVIETSESQFYEKVFEVVKTRPLTFGVGALLSTTPMELTSLIMPLVASRFGRNEQEQLTAFCEEAVLTVNSGRVDDTHALTELKALLGLIEKASDSNAANTSIKDPWIQEFRNTVRIRSWFPDTLMGVLWVAMRMPGPPSDLLAKMCYKPLNCSKSKATANDWKRALCVVPSDTLKSFGIPPFDEPLNTLTAGMTTAQILTTTQSNYDELWTKMGWPCRRRVHDKIKAIRKCWNPKSGMVLCETLLRHIAGE